MIFPAIEGSLKSPSNGLQRKVEDSLRAFTFGLAVLTAGTADASSVSLGSDLFSTQPGASADLSGLGLGVVPVEGVPFGPGNTDTIVQRQQGINPFFPPGATGTVDVEIVALHLRSVDPVDLTALGGPFIGVLANLHLTINKASLILGIPQPDVLAPSLGKYEIRHELGPQPADDIGGTFDSCFGEVADCGTLGIGGGGVCTNAIFTTVDGDPSDAADVLLSQPLAKLVRSATDSTWFHASETADAHAGGFSAGSFFVNESTDGAPLPWIPAVILTATMVDTLGAPGSGDLNSDGEAGPGDTLSYSVEIESFEDLTNFQFSDTIDANTTLDPLTLQVSPLAVDESFETLPDTQLVVGDPLQGVLANDLEFKGETIGTDPANDTVIDDGGSGFPLNFNSKRGGSVSLSSDGTFTYDPPIGFEGTDSFEYSLVDLGGLLGSGNVFIDVSPPLACDGIVVNDTCWWFSQNNGDSCDDVCALHGGYDEATRTFAGSDGSDANCNQVMTALIPLGAGVDPDGAENQSGALGCAQDFSGTAFTVRFTDPTTSAASGFNIRRACACNNQPPPNSISYASDPFTFDRGLAVSEFPTVDGFVTFFSINPPVPGGLNFGTGTGEIFGTPTVNQAPANHTVTATNAGGLVNTMVSIEIVAFPPQNLSYPGSPFVVTEDVAIVPILPTVTGAVDSFSIDPALPGNLNFDTDSGAITGIPLNIQGPTDYTVTATNSDGSDDEMISIEVIAGVAACNGVVIGGRAGGRDSPVILVTKSALYTAGITWLPKLTRVRAERMSDVLRCFWDWG